MYVSYYHIIPHPQSFTPHIHHTHTHPTLHSQHTHTHTHIHTYTHTHIHTYTLTYKNQCVKNITPLAPHCLSPTQLTIIGKTLFALVKRSQTKIARRNGMYIHTHIHIHTILQTKANSIINVILYISKK